jgi:hypothetical protein
MGFNRVQESIWDYVSGLSRYLNRDLCVRKEIESSNEAEIIVFALEKTITGLHP